MDKARLITMLRDSGLKFVGSFRGLSEAQFHFKPEPDRWSIAETAEHVIVAETGSGKLLAGKLTREPTPPELLAGTADAEMRIESRLTTRDRLFPAPEFVLPKGRWKTPEEMAAVFYQSRSATIELFETSPIDFSQYAFPHVALGPLNGLQWAYFMVLHALRHIEQIEANKRAAGYPAA
jgi:DinB family protein